MNKAVVFSTFSVLRIREDGNVTDSLDETIPLYQHAGDRLEVWKERSDGFLFVYSDELGIGYWVHPVLIRIVKQGE